MTVNGKRRQSIRQTGDGPLSAPILPCGRINSIKRRTKNLFVFICTGILLPLAWGISKVLKVNFSDNENPLSNLGILFSVNQLLYLLIAMWIYPTIPDKMPMVIAIIFGAHLMPFSWLYKSKVYLLFSIVIPFLALFIGLSFSPTILAVGMTIVETIFCAALMIENKN